MEKRSIFHDGLVVGFDSTSCDPDHELVWAEAEEATRILSHKEPALGGKAMADRQAI